MARVNPTDARSLHEAALRALNYLVAFGALVLAFPVLVVIAVAIKLDSRGPVLYRQLRVGRDRRQQGPEIVGEEGPSHRTGDLGGRPFCMYKFRTMQRDAEADTGPTWSAPGDDRTTGVGRFLRRHRLDELPQLWNVLKGDMAIVGPRPERPVIFQRLREQVGGYSNRQNVLPGITGWAQINRASDRAVGDVEQKLRYDLEYLEHRSLGFDAWVMWKTPLVMARPDLLVGSSADDARMQASGAGRSDGAAPTRFLPPDPWRPASSLPRMLLTPELGPSTGFSAAGSTGRREDGQTPPPPGGRRSERRPAVSAVADFHYTG